MARSKATLHAPESDLNAELTDRGIRFLSLDPGDMDTLTRSSGT